MSALTSLLPPPPPSPGGWRYATVTQSSPLRVQLDGEDSALAITPETLVSGLQENDRVLILLLGGGGADRGQRLIIVGKFVTS